MQDNVSVLLATIIAVIIIVLFPIYNIATRNDNVSKNMVVKATTNFVDDVRNKGYIEADDYYKFLDEIHRTGNSYEVELEVYKPVFIETEEPNTYEEKYVVEYTNSIMSEFNATNLSIDDIIIGEDEEKIIEVSEDITNTVLSQNIYYLNEGYKFYVRVKNTNITQAQVLLDRLLRGSLTERIVVNYGGVVYTNEWTRGEDAVTSNANISISRPMDKEGNEYKYEVIADVYDPYTDEYNTIYGIAVRLSEVTANEEINFILTYEEIEEMAGGKSDRIEHIKSYFEPVGFTADEDVVEVEDPVQNSDGTWNYIYLITLTNIQYDFENNPYLNATVKVRSGSADTKAGMLGTLNSEEFVLFYEKLEALEITWENTYQYFVLGGGTVTVNIKVNREPDEISDIRYIHSKQEVTVDAFLADNSYGTPITYNEETDTYTWKVKYDDRGTYYIYVKDINNSIKVARMDIVWGETMKLLIRWDIEDKYMIRWRRSSSLGMGYHFSWSGSCRVFNDSTPALARCRGLYWYSIFFGDIRWENG